MPANDRSFINDAQGLVLQSTQGTNVLRQLIVGGQVLGRYGMGIDEADPRDSNGEPRFTSVSDFDSNFRGISGSYPSASSGSYQVQAGETLQSIAQAAYGDRRLWWKIAEANGLRGNDDLRAGQTLNIPGVASSANAADTYRPYDPASMIGDTNPVLPQPGADKGCGTVGMIIVIIVVVVVTILTAGAASSAGGAAAGSGGTAAGTGGAAAGTSGAAAGTSGVAAGTSGVAAGTSGAAAGTSGVAAGTSGATAGAGAATASGSAMSGLSASWSAGLNVLMPGAGAGAGVSAGSVGAAALGGAVGSFVGQVVGNMLGVQDGFDWKGIALGAFGSALGVGLSGVMGTSATGVGMYANAAARAAVANALTQSVAVAIRAQDDFSWRNVAAAAAAGAMSSALGDHLSSVDAAQQPASMVGKAIRSAFGSGAAAQVVKGTLIGFTAGMTAAVVKGGRVHVSRVAADAFGNALGSSLANELRTGAGAGERLAQQAEGRGSVRTGGSVPAEELSWDEKMHRYGTQVAAGEGGILYDAGYQRGGSVLSRAGSAAQQNDPALARISALADGESRALSLHPELGTLGFNEGNGVWTFPLQDAVVEARPLDGLESYRTLQAPPGIVDTLSGIMRSDLSWSDKLNWSASNIKSYLFADVPTLVMGRDTAVAATQSQLNASLAIAGDQDASLWSRLASGMTAGAHLEGLGGALRAPVSRADVALEAAALLPVGKAAVTEARVLRTGNAALSVAGADALFGTSVAQRGIGAGANLNGRNIAAAIDGVAPESSRVAAAIRAGDIKVTVLGDDLFDRTQLTVKEVADGNIRAVAVENRIYLRNSSNTILSDTVHEGTHALDYLDGFGQARPASRWEWEFRAFSAENSFQIGAKIAPDFKSTDDIWFHIWENYKNEPYFPY